MYSRVFKREAVKLVRDRRVRAVQAARDIDLHDNVMRKQVKELSVDPRRHPFPGHGQQKPEQLEIDQLREEVVRLKAERDIQKGHSLHCEGSGMRLAFIARHRHVWPVVWLRDSLDVSGSGFHA